MTVSVEGDMSVDAVSALFDIASLMWMELSMFAVASIIYMVFLGSLPNPFASKFKQDKHVGQRKPSYAKVFAPWHFEKKSPDRFASEDPEAVVRRWQQVRTLDPNCAPEADLEELITAMRKLNKPVQEIVQELKAIIDNQPKLALALSALPPKLLKDDTLSLAAAVVGILDEHGLADPSHYVGLMAAQLRHRDYKGVAATARKVPKDGFTPKMRAILASASAGQRRLDEALDQLRQIGEPVECGRSVVSPASAAHILALALTERRLPETAAELARLRARVETRAFDDLVVASQRQNPNASQELFAVADVLGVAKGAKTFELIAGALAEEKATDAMRRLVAELEGETLVGCKGIVVSEPLCIALLDATATLKDGDVAERVFQMHQKACAGCPGPRALSAACRCFALCDRPEAACDLFENEVSPKGQRLNQATCDALMKAATTLGRSSIAEALVATEASFKKGATAGAGVGSSCNSDLARHAGVIKGHAQRLDLESAATAFQGLRDSGVPLTAMVYNCFLDACVQCGDLDAALTHFAEMRRLGFADIVGYNTMLKAYLSKGKLGDAQGLLAEMRKRGLQANRVTYNELIHAKVLTRDRAGAWQLVDEMHAAGIRSNSVTCSILLKGLVLHTPAEDAERTFALVDEIEEEIDEVLFSSVIEAGIRVRRLPLLTELMRKYRKKGSAIALTAPTYGSMIKAYGQAREVSQVWELWRDMEERGVKPTAITLGCLTEALVANGQTKAALDLVHEQMKGEESKACVNTVIYSTILKGFAAARQIDRVFATYQEMRKAGIACNTVTYNTMLDACAKCCTMNRVPELFEDMRSSLAEPDIITYSTIVKGYCAEGDIDRAFAVLEDMNKDDKFAPDEIMYNSLLDGCARQHRVEDALKILGQMQGNSVMPSNYTLSILVKLLGRARQLNQAFRLVGDLCEKYGFRPNVQVYTCLLQACVLNRKLERALSIHETMIGEQVCAPDEKFYSSLARGCLQLGAAARAAAVVRAAYLLPGNDWAKPQSSTPCGVEPRVLEEVVKCLRGGGASEQSVAEVLVADLAEYRGVRVGVPGGPREGVAAGAPKARRAGAGGPGRASGGGGGRGAGGRMSRRGGGA